MQGRRDRQPHRNSQRDCIPLARLSQCFRRQFRALYASGRSSCRTPGRSSGNPILAKLLSCSDSLVSGWGGCGGGIGCRPACRKHSTVSQNPLNEKPTTMIPQHCPELDPRGRGEDRGTHRYEGAGRTGLQPSSVSWLAAGHNCRHGLRFPQRSGIGAPDSALDLEPEGVQWFVRMLRSQTRLTPARREPPAGSSPRVRRPRRSNGPARRSPRTCPHSPARASGPSPHPERPRCRPRPPPS